MVETFDGIVLRLKVTERELIDFEKTNNKTKGAKPSFESSKSNRESRNNNGSAHGKDVEVTKNIAEVMLI